MEGLGKFREAFEAFSENYVYFFVNNIQDMSPRGFFPGG